MNGCRRSMLTSLRREGSGADSRRHDFKDSLFRKIKLTVNIDQWLGKVKRGSYQYLNYLTRESGSTEVGGLKREMIVKSVEGRVKQSTQAQPVGY